MNASDGGLPKRPLPLARVNAAGVEGDRQHDTRVHGGPFQAVCLFASEILHELGRDGYRLAPGDLGENVTTAGLDYARTRIGDAYRLGPDLDIQITKPRGPCSNLHRYDARLPRRLWGPDIRWGTSGFYARVLAPGTLRPGDAILLLRPGPDAPPAFTEKRRLRLDSDPL